MRKRKTLFTYRKKRVSSTPRLGLGESESGVKVGGVADLGGSLHGSDRTIAPLRDTEKLERVRTKSHVDEILHVGKLVDAYNHSVGGCRQ